MSKECCSPATRRVVATSAAESAIGEPSQLHPDVNKNAFHAGTVEETRVEAVWSDVRWKFVSAVCMALILGAFANEHRSPMQVVLALTLQVAHTAAVWAVAPLRNVGALLCIVEVEQTVILVVAAALLGLGARPPEWLRSWMAWMFSVVIGTMLVGDAIAAVYMAALWAARLVRLRWQRFCSVMNAS
jgi:hypothetical protein